MGQDFYVCPCGEPTSDYEGERCGCDICLNSFECIYYCCEDCLDNYCEHGKNYEKRMKELKKKQDAKKKKMDEKKKNCKCVKCDYCKKNK